MPNVLWQLLCQASTIRSCGHKKAHARKRKIPEHFIADTTNQTNKLTNALQPNRRKIHQAKIFLLPTLCPRMSRKTHHEKTRSLRQLSKNLRPLQQAIIFNRKTDLIIHHRGLTRSSWGIVGAQKLWQRACWRAFLFYCGGFSPPPAQYDFCEHQIGRFGVARNRYCAKEKTSRFFPLKSSVVRRRRAQRNTAGGRLVAAAISRRTRKLSRHKGYFDTGDNEMPLAWSGARIGAG